MRHWILKSEPSSYSWNDLLREGTATWDGVRNFQARNNLRAMACGDLGLLYHSVSEKRVVGSLRIVKSAFPDPTAPGEDWSAVLVEPLEAFPAPVPLATLKADPALTELSLLRQGRLSIAPISAQEFDRIRHLGGLA